MTKNTSKTASEVTDKKDKSNGFVGCNEGPNDTKCVAKETHEAEYDDLDNGWSWMVLLASFGTLVTNGCLTWAVGIMHLTLLDRFNESVFVTSWAGSLNSALTCLAAPLSSALIDRYSCRVAIMTSGVGYVIGYLGAAFAPNIIVAILTCGVISGISGGLAFTASMVVIGFNFHTRRGVALGVAHVGVGVGLFALAPLVQISREYYGTTGFFFILASIAAQNVVFGSMCFPSKLEQSTHRKRRLHAGNSEDNNQFTVSYIQNYIRIICHKSVLCLAVGNFCYLIGVLIIYLHFPSYVIHRGFSATHASFFISLMGIMSAIGRFLTGAIANLNRIPNIILYSGSIGIVAVATCLLPFYSKHLAGNLAFSVIMGMFFGSCFVLLVSVNIDFVGVNYMSAAVGFELCLGGLGSLSGPVIAGLLVDIGGNYHRAMFLAGICMLVAAVLSALSACFKQKDTEMKDKNYNTVEITIEEKTPLQKTSEV